jgi:predicted DNA-binding transcriptional regulator AlpA
MSQHSTALSKDEKNGGGAAPRRGRRLLRPKEAQLRLAVSRTMFWDFFIGKKRLKLVRIGPKAVAIVEDELDALIEQMIADRDTAAE